MSYASTAILEQDATRDLERYRRVWDDRTVSSRVRSEAVLVTRCLEALLFQIRADRARKAGEK